MHYGLNRLKKSKMGKIGLKSSEIAKIGWNRAKSRFQDRFCDFDKMRPWNKIPPPGQLSDAYWIIPAQSWTHVTVFTLLFPIEAKNSFTNHKSQILFPIPTEQIPNRAATMIYSPSSTKAANTQTITPHFTPKKERKKKIERDWQKERGLMNLPRSEDSRTEGLRWEWNQQRENLEQQAPID